MKNKNLILILVIIVALAGAGVFAYISFFGSSSTPTSTAVGQTVGVGAILPYGKNLNFETVNKFNETGRLFPYPEVTPADAGLLLSEIISQ